MRYFIGNWKMFGVPKSVSILNKINNTQAWLLYDDIIEGFRDAKDKQKFLINTLSKYN